MLAFVLLTIKPIYAGVYTNELTKCIVESTSAEDQIEIVRWMYSLISLHPEVKDMSLITKKQREKFDKQIAEILTKLLTESCVKPTEKAIKYEGDKAIETSFSVLGQVAMRELMSNPKVNAGMAGFTKYIDEEKFKSLAP
jgi:hypothetical protein